MKPRLKGLATPAGRHRYERWIAMSALAVLVGLMAAWGLGTRVSLLTTRGSSMAPLFQQGDLAITTRTETYRVGDVVAYRSEPNGFIVLHRIVKFAGGRYTFKGDNNSFLDPDRPTRDKLVGKLAYRISGAGSIADWMTTRTRSLLVMLGAFLLVAGTGVVNRHRARGRPSRDPTRGSARPNLPGIPKDFATHFQELGPAAAALLVAALLCAAAFTRPLTAPTTIKHAYQQHLDFDYTATATRGVTYPDGVVNTGDPIFAKLVTSIGLTASYRLESKLPADTSGTYAFDAELSSGASWTQTVPLVAETSFVGNSFVAPMRLEFDEVRSVVEAMQAETGVGDGAVKILIVPRITVGGTLKGLPIDSTYSKPLSMALSQVELTIDGADAGKPIGTSTTAKISEPSTKTRHITFLSRTMSVARARLFSALAFLAALGWFAYAVHGVEQLRRKREPDRIGHRYHASIVEIASLPDTEHAVDVADMVMLGRLAQRGEHLILHHHEQRNPDEGIHTYLVDDTSTLYRFVVVDRSVAPDKDVEVFEAAEPAEPAEPSGNAESDEPVARHASDEPSAELADAGDATPPPYVPEATALDTPPPYVPPETADAGTPPPYVAQETAGAGTPPLYVPDALAAGDAVPPPYEPVSFDPPPYVPPAENAADTEVDTEVDTETDREAEGAVDPDNAPQSLDEALRLGPITDTERADLGITDSSETEADEPT